MSPIRPWLTVLVLLGSAFPLRTVARADEPSRFRSPQEVVAAAARAVQRNDPKAFCACLTDSTRHRLACNTAFICAWWQAVILDGPIPPEARKPVETLKVLLSANGLPPGRFETLIEAHSEDEDDGDRMLEVIGEDIRADTAFVAEGWRLITIFSDVNRLAEDDTFGAFLGELVDLKIEGAKATAKLKFDEEEPPLEIGFRRTKSGWRVHLPGGWPIG